MKKAFLILSVYLYSTSLGAVVLNEDFSGGIRSELWDTIRLDASGAPWTITAPDSLGSLKLSKSADSDTGLYACAAGITSRFQMVGDFSVSTDFNLVNFPEPNTSGWNEAVLRVGFSGIPFFQVQNLFEVLRYTESNNAQKQWLLGWSSQPPPQTAFGQAPDPTLQGSFILSRSGETLSAWIDRGAGPTLIGSQTSTFFAGPAHIELFAIQQPGLTFPRPSTPLDVRFDNLSVTAEAIVPEPSSLFLIGISVLSFLLIICQKRQQMA